MVTPKFKRTNSFSAPQNLIEHLFLPRQAAIVGVAIATACWVVLLHPTTGNTHRDSFVFGYDGHNAQTKTEEKDTADLLLDKFGSQYKKYCQFLLLKLGSSNAEHTSKANVNADANAKGLPGITTTQMRCYYRD